MVAQCVRAGVTKLVALSAINADDDFSRQPSRFRGDRNREVEQLAVESGRTAFEAGLMEARDFASPSTPVVGTPFWHAVS